MTLSNGTKNNNTIRKKPIEEPLKISRSGQKSVNLAQAKFRKSTINASEAKISRSSSAKPSRAKDVRAIIEIIEIIENEIGIMIKNSQLIKKGLEWIENNASESSEETNGIQDLSGSVTNITESINRLRVINKSIAKNLIKINPESKKSKMYKLMKMYWTYKAVKPTSVSSIEATAAKGKVKPKVKTETHLQPFLNKDNQSNRKKKKQ